MEVSATKVETVYLPYLFINLQPPISETPLSDASIPPAAPEVAPTPVQALTPEIGEATKRKRRRPPKKRKDEEDTTPNDSQPTPKEPQSSVPEPVPALEAIEPTEVPAPVETGASEKSFEECLRTLSGDEMRNFAIFIRQTLFSEHHHVKYVRCK